MREGLLRDLQKSLLEVIAIARWEYSSFQDKEDSSGPIDILDTLGLVLLDSMPSHLQCLQE